MNINKNLKLLLKGDYGNPFEILGMQMDEGKVCIRAFLPQAKEAWVIEKAAISNQQSAISKKTEELEKTYTLQRIHDDGFFEAIIEDGTKLFKYKLKIITHQDEVREFYDPYSFPPVLTDFDLHLIGEGTHYKNYEKLGSHVIEVEGIKGVHFAVWAPNAKKVAVAGGFNDWDVRRHPMRLLGGAGIWEIFIPGLDEGEVYKFEIRSKYKNHKELKTDPFAFFFEVRPKTAAIVYDIEKKYKWHDDEWLTKRKERNWFESPISTYEVHLGSWMRGPDNSFITYRELVDKLIPYVKELGYTHIEFLPVSEHPLDASWGYQTIGYFAPTSRFGRPEDFMYFVDECHRNDIGVIVDWVPAHFPKDAHGLAFFDGTCLYEHADPRKGEHREWGTLIFNYGRNEVRNYLISNALFWLDKYHIDGLRVDAVASMLYLDYSRKAGEWIPNKYGGNENLEAIDFIKKFNEIVHQYFPGTLTIAEESTSWTGVSKPVYLGGLGFSMKWNMGWMHDTLEYFSKDPIHRRYHINNLTFTMLYTYSENFMLPFSHDEVVYGKKSMLDKMPGDMWQKFANLRTLLGYIFGYPGKKLLFMGAEFGQWKEWDFNKGLDWDLLEHEPHKRLLKFVTDLNSIYKTEPALYEMDFDWHGFEWIDFRDSANSVISFIRKSKDPEDLLVLVLNLTPVPRLGYKIGVPLNRFYKEILNSDSDIYWGSNMGNSGGVAAENKPWHGKKFSLTLTLPPLSILILKPEK